MQTISSSRPAPPMYQSQSNTLGALSQRGCTLILASLFTVFWQVADILLPGDRAGVNCC